MISAISGQRRIRFEPLSASHHTDDHRVWSILDRLQTHFGHLSPDRTHCAVAVVANLNILCRA